jgi:nucleotide-binding universal stress UspA family protein
MYRDEQDIEYALHPIYEMQQEASICAAAERMLVDVQQQLEAAGFTVTVEVRFGKPAEEILAAAQEHDASLIAMATHDGSVLRHVVLGSVAEQVLHDAPVPVLLVGPAVLAADHDDHVQQLSIADRVA